jgi:hypothetical protein
MSNLSQGFVFSLGDVFFGGGCFGVLSYRPETVVSVMLGNGESVQDACDKLSKRYAGRFIPADRAEESWGKAVLPLQPFTVLL